MIFEYEIRNWKQRDQEDPSLVMRLEKLLAEVGLIPANSEFRDDIVIYRVENTNTVFSEKMMKRLGQRILNQVGLVGPNDIIIALVLENSKTRIGIPIVVTSSAGELVMLLKSMECPQTIIDDALAKLGVELPSQQDKEGL